MAGFLNMESRQIVVLLIGFFAAVFIIVIATNLGGNEIVVTEDMQSKHELPVEKDPEPPAPAEDKNIDEPKFTMEETKPSVEPGSVETVDTIDDKIEENPATPIGNRLVDVEEDDVALDSRDVILLKDDKTMSGTSAALGKGESLTWMNEDGSPHLLIIEKGGTLVEKSPRLATGDTYTYTFSAVGEYVVRDTFAGTMRMAVKVK